MGKMIADDLIAVAAFRYALGRKTYIVSHIARWLIANKDALRRDAPLYVREIDKALECSALGMDIDRAEWMRVREVFAPAEATGEGGGHG